MRIEDIEHRSLGDRTRIEARFVFEDADLPPYTVYYEAGPPLADVLEASSDAFALCGFPLAAWEGERRLKVDGTLDTTLATGLGRAGVLLSHWYDRCGTVALEPMGGFHALRPRTKRRPVGLFSGGVDALAMLCENRKLLPLDHPDSLRTLVYAFGYSNLDQPDAVESPVMRARYEAQARRIEELGERVGFTLARLETNVRHLHPVRDSWYYVAHSAAFLAPLVASPGYLSDAVISSAGEAGPVQSPHGSHPVLDAYYSTGAVRVQHAQPQVGRTEKLEMIGAWEPASDVLQVCHGEYLPTPETINCGICEKCVRTQVALASIEALSNFTTFPGKNINPDRIEALKLKTTHDYLFEPDLLERLERIGRDDLVAAIRAKAREIEEAHHVKRKSEVKWWEKLKGRFGRAAKAER